MEPLHNVFARTAKSPNTSGRQLTFKEVKEALRDTCGIDALTGVIITARSVEVAVNSNAAYNDLLQQPARIPETQHYLRFEPAYQDIFHITIYNVPLGSTGYRERKIIEAAGATVLDFLVVQHNQDGEQVITSGERVYRCTDRHKFTYLPKVITSYGGRKMGCRYRGQAHDLATKIPSLHNDPDTALSSHSNWASTHQSSSSPPVPISQPVCQSDALSITSTTTVSSELTPISSSSLSWGEQMEKEDNPGPITVVALITPNTHAPDVIMSVISSSSSDTSTSRPPLPGDSLETGVTLESPSTAVIAAITSTETEIPPASSAAPSGESQMDLGGNSASAPVIVTTSPVITLPPSVSVSLPAVSSSARSTSHAHTTTTNSITRSRASDRESSLHLRSRSRSPVHSNEPSEVNEIANFHKVCSHKCVHCPEVFQHAKMYNQHRHQQHPIVSRQLTQDWEALHSTDINLWT